MMKILKKQERINRPARFEPRDYDPKSSEREAEHKRLEKELGISFLDSRKSQTGLFQDLGVDAL